MCVTLRRPEKGIFFIPPTFFVLPTYGLYSSKLACFALSKVHIGCSKELDASPSVFKNTFTNFRGIFRQFRQPPNRHISLS